MSTKIDNMFPYLHGFSEDEQNRLRKQARFAEQTVYRDIDFSKASKILEVGSGVGAQTEILLRRFPQIFIEGIDLNENQLNSAQDYFKNQPEFSGRYQFQKMNAENLEFESQSFDGAFLCWVLEHVPHPSHVVNEVRRVLKAGAPIYVTEVMNATFFLDPYSPNLWKYWMAFNDYQYEGAGDPFIGVKLGNILSSLGFRDIVTKPKTWYYDNRHPERRREMIAFWLELMLSASDQLIKSNYVTQKVVEAAINEIKQVQKDPNAVFYYSLMQASALK